MTLDKIQVANRIKSIRQEKGLTMEEFGNLIGDVKKSAVGNWERGDNFPNNECLKRIAEIGDMSVEELLGTKVVTIKHIKAFEERIKLVIVGSDDKLYSYDHSRTYPDCWKFHRLFPTGNLVVDKGEIAEDFSNLKTINILGSSDKTAEQIVLEIKENFKEHEIKQIIRQLT